MPDVKDDREEDVVGSNDSKIHNPHDSFFREMMREPKVYRAFIKRFLPEDIRGKIDLRTIRPTGDHFIDERLRHLYSDSLFRVRTKGGIETMIYFLVEHFSYADYWSAFRSWKYIVAIWDELIRELEGRQGFLPLVIPVIVYNGKRPFNAPLAIGELIEGDRALIDRVLFGPAHLVDLSTIEDSVLREESHLAVAMMTLKHAFDVVMPLESLVVNLRGVKDPNLRRRFLFALVHYIFSIRDDASEEDLRQLIADKLEWQGDDVMTVAEKLRAEGREEGREVGRVEGRVEGHQTGILEVARNLLRKGFAVGIVHETTGLSKKEIRSLKLDLA